MTLFGALSERSDTQVARLLAGGCVCLYLSLFGILFSMGSANGASLQQMTGLGFSNTADTTEYVQLAQSMLAEGRFALPESGSEFLRTPGYPSFIALVLLIFKTPLVVPLFQILFTALTVALIYLIGARYFPRVVSIAAATLYVVDPIVIYAAWTPISESLFMLFFMASVYAIGTPSKRAWIPFALAAVFLALATYVRPLGLYAAPFLLLMALARVQWRATVRGGAIFLAVFLALLSPWMVRNYLLSGHFAFSSTGAYGLYANNMPLFEQVRTGVSYLDIQKKYNAEFGTNDEHVLRSFKYSTRESAIAKSVILAHPFQYIIFHLLKSAQLFVGSSIVNVTYHMHVFGILPGEHAQGEGAWGMLVQHHWREAFFQVFGHIPRLLERTFWVLAYCSALSVAVLAVFRRERNWRWIVCAFLLLNFVALLTGPVSDDTRYRMPLEPFLLLLASRGMHSLWQWFRARRAVRVA